MKSRFSCCAASRHDSNCICFIGGSAIQDDADTAGTNLLIRCTCSSRNAQHDIITQQQSLKKRHSCGQLQPALAAKVQRHSWQQWTLPKPISAGATVPCCRTAKRTVQHNIAHHMSLSMQPGPLCMARCAHGNTCAGQCPCSQGVPGFAPVSWPDPGENDASRQQPVRLPQGCSR